MGDLDFERAEPTSDDALLSMPELLDDEVDDESQAEAPKAARTYTGRVSQTVGLQKTLDATQIYLNEIGFSALLTPQEEVHFARLAVRGDEAGRRRMIDPDATNSTHPTEATA